MAPIRTPPVSQRDPAGLRADFERWLSARQAGAAVAGTEIPAPSGMSNQTILIDAGWGGQAHRLAIRIGAAPVLPRCDIRYQFLTLRRLGSQVVRAAVPRALWYEEDPQLLGGPFLVMSRVDGQIPPGSIDRRVAPYTFGCWLSDAVPADRLRMQRATVEQLARVH
ncbi:MAG TPA: phosphotransferase, partial [Mycobacterium sp.]|nr:phosphotransferase [Mycobacterium sp.]